MWTKRNLLVTEQEEGLLGLKDGPVLDNSIDLRQVLRTPLGDSTQQQVEKSIFFVTAVTLTPEELLLVVC